MGDLAYLNLLREKVRQLEDEQQRAIAFGASRPRSFVPWVMPKAAIIVAMPQRRQ